LVIGATKRSSTREICPQLRPGASPLRILQEVFGLPHFRLDQEKAIDALVKGKNAFVLMVHLYLSSQVLICSRLVEESL
jgi:hypothetical protein